MPPISLVAVACAVRSRLSPTCASEPCGWFDRTVSQNDPFPSGGFESNFERVGAILEARHRDQQAIDGPAIVRLVGIPAFRLEHGDVILNANVGRVPGRPDADPCLLDDVDAGTVRLRASTTFLVTVSVASPDAPTCRATVRTEVALAPQTDLSKSLESASSNDSDVQVPTRVTGPGDVLRWCLKPPTRRMWAARLSAPEPPALRA